MIPGHHILGTLKEVRGERVVLRTRLDGRDAVTRVLGRPIDLAFDPLVAALTKEGRGSLAGLPEELVLTLEAYRLRATLGETPGLPRVLSAGVTAGIAMSSLPLAGPGQGHVWVTSEWADGDPLSARFPALSSEERGAALAQVVEILDRLHGRRALFGDLKPSNVVIGAAGVSFIDIDTLREVPAPNAPVPTRDLTPRYAAPEQTAQRVSYLASDVYAFGVMAAQLATGRGPEDTGFPGAIGQPWDEIVRACLRPAPGARPTTGQLLAHLRGEASLSPQQREDGTERVADPTAVDRLPLAPARGIREELPGAMDVRIASGSQERAAPIATPRPRRWWRWVVVAILAIGGVAVGLVVLDELAAEAARLDALRIAEAQYEALRRHKTVKVENTNKVVEGIVVEAARGLALAETDLGRGVYALATVWSQRWHYSGAGWDPGKFARGEAAASGAEGSVEGRLARALLAGAGCRLMKPDDDPRRQAFCAEAKSRYVGVIADLSGSSEHGWLLVEAAWGELGVVLYESYRLRKNGMSFEAETRAAEALARCDTVRDSLVFAPVNGREVAEDCLSGAGAARDFPKFLEWANWLVEHDLAASQKVDAERTLPKLYKFPAPECAEMKVEVGKNLRPRLPGRGTGGWADLCDFVGLVALGCMEEAAARRPVDRGWLSATYVEQKGVPWAAALAATGAGPRRSCALPAAR